jgi:hypothetical protein
MSQSGVDNYGRFVLKGLYWTAMLPVAALILVVTVPLFVLGLIYSWFGLPDEDF